MRRSNVAVVALVALVLSCAVCTQARKNPLKPGKPVPFPFIDCKSTANLTVFRVKPTITREPVARTWCFGISTGAAALPNSPCAQAAKLEKFELWASRAQRWNVSIISIRDLNGRSDDVSATWVRDNGVDASQPFIDHLIIAKLNFSPEYVMSAQPRICFTLNSAISLDDLCLGPQGSCYTSLYSTGSGGAKCCPTSATPVPA